MGDPYGKPIKSPIKIGKNTQKMGWLGVFKGDDMKPKKPRLFLGIIISHYKDPVINHPGFNGK